MYPNAAILAHPESPQAVVELAGAVELTSQLIQAAKTLPNKRMIVATDRGIFYKMQQACSDKELFEAPTVGKRASCRSCAHCPWMAMNDLKAIPENLVEQGGIEHGIQIDATLRKKVLARPPLNRMLNSDA